MFPIFYDIILNIRLFIIIYRHTIQFTDAILICVLQNITWYAKYQLKDYQELRDNVRW